MNAVTGTTPQKMSTLLSQVAVVAKLRTSTLGLTRTDKEASRRLDAQHNARQGTGKAIVSRLAGAESRVKEIIATIGEGGECLKASTTQWGDKRLLVNVNIERFLRQFSPIAEKFKQQVATFVADAPDMIAAAESNKGDYNVQPPTLEEIRDAFKLEFELEAIADSSKYESNLDKAVTESLKRRFEAQVEAAYAEATKDAVQRLAKPLANLADRMTVYSKREDDKANGVDVDSHSGTFKDSIISNVQEIAAVFGSFNITGDPTLARVADALKAFEGVEAADLRKHQRVRDEMKAKAEAILASLGDWLD